MGIAEQNAKAFIPVTEDLIAGSINIHFPLILTYKTALIFHAQSIEE